MSLKREIEIYVDNNEMVIATFSVENNKTILHKTINFITKDTMELTKSQEEFIINEVNYILELEIELDKEEKGV